MRKRRLPLVALVLAVALFAAACGGSDNDNDEGTSGTGEGQTGGTLRVETDGFGWSNAFDPTGEYWGVAWSYYRNLLTRTLVTYRNTVGAPGNEVVPDLATDLGQVSDDGKTYTFTLKDGIKFGPPVSREITSKDIEYAFRRIATKSLVAQYAAYYTGTIEGLEVGAMPDHISGIETPDDKTIVFHLTKDTPDFLFRLAMPAAGPIPEEVGKCFTKPGEYGRYLISSGPYMIEGSKDLDISSCDSMKPLEGFNPDDHLYVERNPDYDPATDSKEDRANYFDEMTIDLNTNPKDIWNKIQAGELDAYTGSGTPPPDILKRYSTDSDLKDNLKVSPEDRTWYLTMNLGVAPFDDIHVRKAANLVMDKDSLRRAWGGEIAGDIATHLEPPSMTGGTPTAEEYDPYPSDNFAGDVDAAKEEMKQSKYDTDHDGMCDAPECKGVLTINRNVPPWTDMEPIVQQSLAKIGIEVDIREQTPDAAYTTIQTPAKNIPLGMNPGWGKDYSDPDTFVGFLFDGRNIAATGNYNYSLVGLTADKAKEVNFSPASGVNLGDIPSVDSDIDKCLDTAGDARNECWIALDKHLSEDVVPWVPYLWANVVTIISDAVTSWDYDQASGTTAWSKLAVDPSLQK
ncbi:MAG TPA: ABC transporter substrate-binding protein [Actinomycetota bacterium]|nr:ABC transporter substrate-binding protein [Actinomycetota bacterium]